MLEDDKAGVEGGSGVDDLRPVRENFIGGSSAVEFEI
jgi:hypothetical protein